MCLHLAFTHLERRNKNRFEIEMCICTCMPRSAIKRKMNGVIVCIHTNTQKNKRLTKFNQTKHRSILFDDELSDKNNRIKIRRSLDEKSMARKCTMCFPRRFSSVCKKLE